MNPLATEVLHAVLQTADDPASLAIGLYDSLLAWSMRCTGAEEGGVLSIAENGNSMRIERWAGEGVDVKSRILPLTRPPQSICGRCVLRAQPLVVPDVRNDPLFVPRSDSAILSELVVPVCSGDKVIGLVNLESNRLSTFTENHADLVFQFTREIAPVWKLVATAMREQRHVELLKSLQGVSESLLTEDPETTLERILGEALRLTDSVLGGVCLLSTDKEALAVGPAKGLKPGLDKKPMILRGTGFAWRSITERRSQNVPDIREHRPIYHDLSEGHIRSLLCVPMCVGNEPVGTLNVESTELNHFSLVDEEILIAFAYQAAIAVKMLDQRNRFAAADALAALGSLSGNLTHTINNSVGGIRVLSKMLAHRLERSSTDLQGMAEEIHEAATQTLRVVEHYEEMFSLEENPLDTSNLIIGLLSELQKPPAITIRVDLCEPTATVLASPNAFCEIVKELVRNAIKALVDSGSITITTSQNEFHVLISVSDDGSPIPEERRRRLFEKGFSVRSQSVGTGFGLWWIQRYMCKLGGEVRYSPRTTTGNTFQLLFPKINKPHAH